MKWLLLVLAAMLVGCGPSCAERGGKQVFTGIILVPAGKGQLIPISQYRCEGVKNG